MFIMGVLYESINVCVVLYVSHQDAYNMDRYDADGQVRCRGDTHYHTVI